MRSYVMSPQIYCKHVNIYYVSSLTHWSRVKSLSLMGYYTKNEWRPICFIWLCKVSVYGRQRYLCHHSDVIMSAMAFQIIAVSIVYSTFFQSADQKISKLRVTGLCEGNSPAAGQFPGQTASNAENVSTCMQHYALTKMLKQTGYYKSST